MYLQRLDLSSIKTFLTGVSPADSTGAQDKVTENSPRLKSVKTSFRPFCGGVNLDRINRINKMFGSYILQNTMIPIILLAQLNFYPACPMD
jgi:hypothetical protein